MADFQYMVAFLRDVSERYRVTICVKDFIGFLPINKQLDQALRPYAAHTNPFCMFIKQEKQMYYKCLSMMRPMYNRCLATQDCFFGVCHAGVYEYVVPIRIADEVLGSINVAYFDGDRQLSHRLIRHLFRNAPDKAMHAIGLFDLHMPSCSAPPAEVLTAARMLAEYLGMTYMRFKSAGIGGTGARRAQDHRENLIIVEAQEYIRMNFASPIRVLEIARHCHCSESYINHMFNKHTGVNINVYINKIRIEHAKNYLLTTSDSIAAIALNVGFSDPNYFSRVFSSLVAIPATEFRRRYTT